MLRRSSQVLLATAARACAPRAAPSAATAFRLQSSSFSTIYDHQTPFEDINRHRSDAEQRIAQVPIVELASVLQFATYIQLDTRKHNIPQTCKYCGVRYKMKEGYHAGH
ncbi:hypothetical protein PInf_022700 [Phytophthora infestans]|nr:hypothetical protein PInf_022700 [Phytophthora infestans]